MATDDRTEKATPKHRQRARDKGQVARSPDLGSSVALVGGLLAVSITGPHVVQSAGATLKAMLAQIAHPQQVMSAAGLMGLMHEALSTIAGAFLPIAGTCLVTGLLASVAQVGFHPSMHALKPDFRRINPVTGAKNLFGSNFLFELFKALAKLLIVGAVVAFALVPGLRSLSSMVGIAPAQLGTVLGGRALSIAQRAAFAYVLIGLLDYGWRRYRHEQQLKMTKQQVRDETRQHGVSAEVKAAQRRRRMEAARKRMMAAIPSADVVVTNPTHYAVALMYDGSRTAPEVVAKGKDLIAAQIRRIAEENDVPIVPDPPLARALHSSVEIGQVVPEELYAAVARVLAFVYRLAGRGVKTGTALANRRQAA
jgi:flagellar biosynthetic protein FlhB